MNSDASSEEGNKKWQHNQFKILIYLPYLTGVAILVLLVSFFVFGNNFEMFPHHPKIKSAK